MSISERCNHPKIQENTYQRPDGYHVCRICRRNAVRRFRIAAQEALRRQREIERRVTQEALRNGGGITEMLRNRILEEKGGFPETSDSAID